MCLLLLICFSGLFSSQWPPVEPRRAEWLCDSNNHTPSVLPQGTAFVFAPQRSDTAVSSISLSGIMRRHRGQIVPPNLLAGKKTATMNHALDSVLWINKWSRPPQRQQDMEYFFFLARRRWHIDITCLCHTSCTQARLIKNGSYAYMHHTGGSIWW